MIRLWNIARQLRIRARWVNVSLLREFFFIYYYYLIDAFFDVDSKSAIDFRRSRLSCSFRVMKLKLLEKNLSIYKK